MDEESDPTSGSPTAAGQAGARRLPRTFWVFAGCAAAATAGLVTFPVIAYHLVRDQVTTAALVPVLYAVAMAASGVAALATGWLFDRVHARVLLVLPALVVAVPLLAFNNSAAIVLPSEKQAEPMTDFVGTGPYQLKERKADQYIQLTRFDAYKSPEGEANGYGGARHQYADEIRFVPVPDPNLKSIPSVLASARIEAIESPHELMKQAEPWGFSSMPTLNQTGELKEATWLTRIAASSSWKASRSADVLK